MATFSNHEGFGGDVRSANDASLGLRHYLDVVRRRKWIVLPIVVAAIAAALSISLAMDPVYQAKTKMVVGQGNSLFQPGQANAVQPFTATMGDLVKSNVVAAGVIRRLGLTMTPEDLLNKMDVSINPQTAVVKIAVRDHEKARAVAIAQNVGDVFSRLVEQRFGTEPITTTAGSPPQLPLTATIFDPAHVDPDPVSPKPLRNTVLAGVLGIILGLLAAFLREHFDRDLRTREAVEESFGAPVIGQIPSLREKRAHSVLDEHSFGAVDEAFRGLRANLQYLAVRRPLRTILVTSASPHQGKTTVTANLAVVLARSGSSTVAVEADLRRPRLSELFERANEGAGLTGVLVGASDLDDAIVDLSYADAASARSGTEPGRLSFLPSGPLPPNPTELLSSAPMTKVLDRLAVLYDDVVIDSPPILLVADALELARVVDGVIMVVRRNETTTDEAREVRALVDRLGINLIGVVFTDAKGPPSYSYGPYTPAQKSEERQPTAVRSGL